MRSIIISLSLLAVISGFSWHEHDRYNQNSDKSDSIFLYSCGLFAKDSMVISVNEQEVYQGYLDYWFTESKDWFSMHVPVTGDTILVEFLFFRNYTPLETKLKFDFTDPKSFDAYPTVYKAPQKFAQTLILSKDQKGIMLAGSSYKIKLINSDGGDCLR